MAKSNIDKMCLGKTRYETYEDALSCAEYILEDSGVKLYVYNCKICNGYHLTNKKVTKKVR